MGFKSASFRGLRPASAAASRAARGASQKSGTRPERVLQEALSTLGCSFVTNDHQLPGRPDLIFAEQRVVVFCDGDFWHGKDWEARRQKLMRGSNPDYWIAKIEGNRARDKRNTAALCQDGWTVLRFWESDIMADLPGVVERISRALRHKP